MSILWIDFETKSRCDLKAKGVYNYARDGSTDVLCMSWAFDDEDVQTWLPGQPFPERVRNHTGQIRAHNAAFERLVFWYVLQIDFALEQFYCTATQARANCAPGSLEDVGRFFGASMRKDHRGGQLVRALCIPRADGSFNDDPALMAELVEYCEQDVRAMRDISKATRNLSAEELTDYHVNERINDRGVLVDVPLARAAMRYAAAELEEIQKLVVDITEGAVPSVRSPRMREWVWDRVGPQARDVMTVTKGDVTKRSIDKNVRASLLVLAEENPDEVPPDVADVVQCADDLWASSVAKFARMDALADEEDQRVRGAFVFAGGAATGRSSSFGLQVHNFARKTAKDPEAVRHAMVRGRQIVPVHGKRVTDVLKGMLRPALIPSPGRKLVTADWSAIEARVNPWLSNCPSGEAKLDLFRTGEDIYKVNASTTFSVAIEDVDDPQRQVGKVQELACLSEDTLVLTICGEKAIQDVRAGDLVWDGLAWVSTDGAIFKGERHVIEHDGLCATPDHLVWVEGAADPIEFGRAAADGLRLVRARASDKAAVPVAREAADGSEAAVREPEFEGLQILWGAGRIVRLPDGGERVCVGAGEHRASARGDGIGPHGQRQELCAGELALVDQGAKPATYVDLRERVGAARLSADASRGEICRQHDEEPVVDGPDLSADRGEVGAPELQTKRRVWDLLNCGPLHRFTASGRLVHNCGFGGAVGAFNAMGRVYGVLMPEAQSRRMVEAWRRANPWAVDQWSALEQAYTMAMRQQGREFTAGRVTYLFDGRHLWYALPSGRVLCYPDARRERDGTTYSKAAWKPAQGAAEWPRARLWPGLACENIVQAVANDLLRHALRSLDGGGAEVILHVHDEVVLEAEDTEDAAALLEAAMLTPPAWATGLPLAAEVMIRERYGK